MNSSTGWKDLFRRPVRASITWLGWVIVSVFCVGLFWVALPVTVAHYDISLPFGFLAVTGQCAAIALAIRAPIPALVVELAATVFLATLTAHVAERPWPLTIPGFVALAAFLATIGLRERLPVLIGVWWASMGALVAIVVLSPGKLSHSSVWGDSLIVIFTITLLVLAASFAIGQGARVRRELLTARRDVELEQARRQYVEERGRIARELHDIVAHSMSIIHMQAISAPFRMPGLTADVAGEFESIAGSAKSALGEMRQLLGALRDEDDIGMRAPQPQVSDLIELIESVERSGIVISARTDDRATGLSPVVQLTVYRIVQEALSNVVRHAPGAAVVLGIVVGDAGATTVIVNNGPPSRPSSRELVSAGGQGLRGMAERVALLGGTLAHGAASDGGFRVRVLLPGTGHDDG